MTDKQRLFINAKLSDPTMTDIAAARIARYSLPDKQATQVANNPRVKHALEERRAQLDKQANITAERVLQEYVRIGFASIDDVLSFNASGVQLKDSADLSDDTLATIESVQERMGADGASSLKVKQYDKLKALDALAKHLGILDERPNLFINIKPISFVRVEVEGEKCLPPPSTP